MVHADDKTALVRKFRHKGSRKTGKVPFADIQRVLQALEAEAEMPRWDRRAKIRAENFAALKDRSVAGFAQRCSASMSYGSWRLLLAIGIPLYTGYRSSDVIDLKWGDLLFMREDGKVSVRDTLTVFHEKKTTKRREIPINDDLARYIINAFHEIKPRMLDTYVFKSKFVRDGNRDKPVTRKGFWRMITDAFARFGVYDQDGTVSAHCLRKSYAFAMFEKLGGDYLALIRLQKILNHYSIDDTIRYLDVRLSESADAHLSLSFRSEGSSAVVRSFTLA